MNINNDTLSANARIAYSQATNPNFVYKTKNTYGVTGMELTGGEYKIVEVSGDIKDKLKSLAKSIFLDNYGMNDGEESSALMRKYIASSPEKDRLDVSWTLNQIWNKEYGRIENLVSEAIPGWKPGKEFDRDFVNQLISRGSIDQKI